MRTYLLIGSVLLLTSCSQIASYFESDHSKTVRVRTCATTNESAPVHLFITSTDFAHYLMDDYPTVAAAATFPEEDRTPLATLCLIPGSVQVIIIKPIENQAVAFYALFTKPGPCWKTIINTEKPFKSIDIVLGENEIKSIEVR